MFNPSRTTSLVIVLLLTCVALGRTCTLDFTEWDDPGTIACNTAFNPPTFTSIATYWRQSVEGLYAPLTYTVWGGLALAARVDQSDEFGSTLNPAIYHSANLVIHLITVSLVFLLLHRLTRFPWAAMMGAAVFAVHPVQVETVAWASGTKDLLCGMFIAAALYGFIRHRTSKDERARNERARSESAGIERTGIERAKNERTGIGRAGIERAGIERTGIERAGIERTGIEGTGIERSGIERAGIQRTGIERASNDRARSNPAGIERAIIERAIAERAESNRLAGKLPLICSITAMLLACLCKPTGIVAAAMALALDAAYFRMKIKTSLTALWPGVMISLIFVVVGRIAQPPLMPVLPPLWIRPLIATDSAAFYLFKLLWPARLSFDYGRTTALAIGTGAVYYTWILPAATTVVAVRMRSRLPLLATGMTLALLGVAPVLGLVSFTFQAYSTVADHYLYPAMIGVAVAVGAVTQLLDSRALRVAACAVIIACGVKSFVTAAAWQNTLSLTEHGLAVNPASFLSHGLRATNLIRHGELGPAESDLRAAIVINPEAALARNTLVGLLVDTHRPDEAIEQFREVMRLFSRERDYDTKTAVAVSRGFAAKLRTRGYPEQADAVLNEFARGD